MPWVFGPGEEWTLGFSNFGLENVHELVCFHKADPGLLKRGYYESLFPKT